MSEINLDILNRVEVIVGTYEEFLLGYKVENSQKKGEDGFTLTQSFATRSHTASIRCVATCGKYLASGGADDRIFIYDMKDRKEIQILMHHEGTVNALSFSPDATHLLSGGDDGQMVAVRLNSWQIEGLWKKAHSGSAITRITCHPSGKLAFSLGSDIKLRTWNLVKGRLAYAINLKSKQSLGQTIECLALSPEGDYFVLTGSRIIEIWSTDTAGMIKDEKTESKPTAVCWLSNSLVLVGLENGKMFIMDLVNKDKAKYFEAHKQRVKDIAYVNDVLATTSSSGDITLWTVNMDKKTLKKVCSTNIGCRPTCLTLLDLTPFGDDYILKRRVETEVTETESPVILQQKPQKRSSNVGTVTVEYDDDDDNMSAEEELNAIEDDSLDIRKNDVVKKINDQKTRKENKHKLSKIMKKTTKKSIEKNKIVPLKNIATHISPINIKKHKSKQNKNNSINSSNQGWKEEDINVIPKKNRNK